MHAPLTPSPLKPASVNNGKAWKGILFAFMPGHSPRSREKTDGFEKFEGGNSPFHGHGMIDEEEWLKLQNSFKFKELQTHFHIASTNVEI